MPVLVRKVAIAWHQFLSCLKRTMTSGQYRFFRLVNLDWSIQISDVPAVCKTLTIDPESIERE